MNELKFLLLLMNSSHAWTKKELAQKMGTSVRTIERYIVKIKAAGFIFNEQRGEVTLKQHSAIYDSLSRLVYFSEEDAATLYNALDAIETNTEAKEALRKKLGTIYSTKTVKEKIIRLNRSHKAQDIMRAIEERKRVILKNYSSPSSRTLSDRLVEPFQMADGDKQVWCWEIETGKNKVFNLSRIEEVVVLKENWKSRVCHEAGFTDAFRMISFNGKTLPVSLRLNQMAFNLLVEEYPKTESHITQTAEGEWLYEDQVASYKGVGRFVLGLADCIQVETKSLQDYLYSFADLYLTRPESPASDS